MDIEAGMEATGYTTSKLAELSGVEASNLSAYKNGSRTLGKAAAERLARHLPANAFELMVGNRTQMLERSAVRKDARGVLNAARGFVDVYESVGVKSTTVEEKIERVVDFAVRFSQEHGKGAAGG